MRFSRRPRAVDRPSDDSLALLSALPPRYAADVRLSRTSLVWSRRRLEVRANHVLLLKPPQHNTFDNFYPLRADDVTLCVPLSSIKSSSSAAPVSSSPISFVHSSSPSMLVTEKRRTMLILCGSRVSFSSDADVRTFQALLLPPQQQTTAVHDLTEEDEKLLASDSKLSSLPLLGSGATAEVRQLRPHVAVKLVRKADVFDNDGALQQAVSERLAFGWFQNNPFLLHLLAARQTERFLCFVTEAAHFGDLHSVLARVPRSRFPAEVARVVFAELVSALAAVHRAGVLFRDVKLANVLITETGHVRLADFGLVKRLAAPGAANLNAGAASVKCPGSPAKVVSSEISSASSTESSSVSSENEGEEEEDFDDKKYAVLGRTSSFVGTRRYMSPELCGNGGNSVRSYGAPADLWALGVTLYVMLTGRYPFTGSESPSPSSLSSTAAAGIGDMSAPADSRTLFLSIRNDDVYVPDFVDKDAASLVQGLLTRDALDRLDIAAVMKHPWLRDINWAHLHRDGLMDTPNDVVLGFLREYNVPSVVERRTSTFRRVMLPEESVMSDENVGTDDAMLIASNLYGFETCA